MAEKTEYHNHDILCHDTCVLVTRESITIPECDSTNSRLYTLDIVDGMDEKIIS